MNVERYGEGDSPYLGVHGWAGNHRTFKPLLSRMPADSVFYSVDLPGYGNSPAPGGEWDIEEVARLLAGEVERLPNPPVTLVGFCGGGNLAMMAARHLGGKVRRLVLIDPFAYMPLYFKVFTWGEFGRRAYFTTFANPLGRWFTNSALRGKRTGKASLTQSFENVDHEMTLRAIRGLAKFPPYESFAELDLRVDLAYGERSFKAVRQSVALWKQVWPHARICELKGAGHSPIIEATAQLSRIVFDAEA